MDSKYYAKLFLQGMNKYFFCNGNKQFEFLKIAFLSVFHPYRGGISQFSTSLYQSLEKRSEIRAFNFKRQYPKLFFPGKSQYVSTEKNNPFHSYPLLDSINPLSYQKTAREINAYSPDLLLTNFWLPFFGPALGNVAKRMHQKCKKISILHNVIPHESRPFDKRLTKYFLNKNDAFVILSEQVKRDLLKIKPGARFLYHRHPLYDHFGQIQEKNSARASLGIPKDKNVLLFFGFIRKYKGLDKLLSAFRSLSNEYHLIIAGECYDNFEQYQSIIDAHLLSDRITLKNKYIPFSEVGKIFSASDLVILPYRSATQSGITAIAYHFSKPVMVSDVGGLAESVVEGKTGYIIKDPSPAAFASQIQSVFPLPQNMEIEIKKLKKELSWDTFADHLLEFISDV